MIKMCSVLLFVILLVSACESRKCLQTDVKTVCEYKCVLRASSDIRCTYDALLKAHCLCLQYNNVCQERKICTKYENKPR